MRPTKELLQLVQKEYKERALVEQYSENNRDKDYNGLCYVVIILFRAKLIKLDERYFLIDIIKNVGKKKGYKFFTFEGRKTDCPSQFVWRAIERPPRLAWLRNQIKKC